MLPQLKSASSSPGGSGALREEIQELDGSDVKCADRTRHTGSYADSSDVSAEIIIVGAGVAGAALAAVLGAQGRRVILVDPRSSCPQVFKAEKLDHEQVQQLRD